MVEPSLYMTVISLLATFWGNLEWKLGSDLSHQRTNTHACVRLVNHLHASIPKVPPASAPSLPDLLFFYFLFFKKNNYSPVRYRNWRHSSDNTFFMFSAAMIYIYLWNKTLVSWSVAIVFVPFQLCVLYLVCGTFRCFPYFY